MKRLFFILLITVFIYPVDAQKVGVVLSGGGAKGLAHIGVLKALEENNIPIDYVVGTSMGGIIAGGYAAGISPYQLEDIVLSGDFLGWIHGVNKKNYNNYGEIKRDPGFATLNLSLDSTFISLLNYNLAKDWSLNFAMSEIMATPSAIARSRFDSLFVPLRVEAADIFTQSDVSIDSGLLSEALRVTQTVPFFYRPIKVNNKYLFDGGLYNNFPISVMRKSFSPDVIIGSNVSTSLYKKYPYKDDEKLIDKALMFILLNKSDLSDLSEKDIYIEPNVKEYKVFDFSKAKSLIDSGYRQTLRQMDTIKSKIAVRRSCEVVSGKRNMFNNKARPLLFDKILFDNFRKGQERYLRTFFRKKNTALKYFSEIKNGYYELMSEPYFHSIYPSIVYDTITHFFNFKLTRQSQSNFQVDLGGVVATRNISSIFLGISHFYFRDVLIHSRFSFYGGNFYKSARVRFRIAIPSFRRIYLEPQLLYNSWDFSWKKGLLDDTLNPTILYTLDYKAGLSINIFLGKNYKASIYGNYVYNKNRYINGEFVTSVDTLDNLQLTGVRTGISFSTYSLNRQQYASRGKSLRFSLDYFALHERFMPGSTSMETQGRHYDRNWFRVRATIEQYFGLGKIYTIGYYLDGLFSNQPPFANYQGSLINAPAFNPMQDSKTLFLRNFRAFSSVGIGLRNIILLYKNLDLRLSGYIFNPFSMLKSDSKQRGIVVFDPFSSFFLAATVGLVYHTVLGPVSISVNYYDDAYRDTDNQFGFLLHIGFLLFNKAALE